MPISTAHVATAKPAPYMKQLCRHFGHKVNAEFTDTSGRIEFEYGVLDLDATGEGVLVMTATAEDSERLERLEGTVGRHLERFGRRDELSVTWDHPASEAVPPAGT